MNALNIIRPYRYEGTWVFDDTQYGLLHEPFVAGADTLIDRAVADIPNAAEGFSLIFSAEPFPNLKLDLSSGAFGRIDLSQFDLSGANCKDANFTEGKFQDSNLSGTDFSHALLERADLTDADLSDVNLRRRESIGGQSDRN